MWLADGQGGAHHAGEVAGHAACCWGRRREVLGLGLGCGVQECPHPTGPRGRTGRCRVHRGTKGAGTVLACIHIFPGNLLFELSFISFLLKNCAILVATG